MKKGHRKQRPERREEGPVRRAAPPPPPVVRLPPRARPPAMPARTVAPEVGQWLWTCRAGFEAQLFEELAWAKAKPQLVGTALVASQTAPAVAPTFARMGFAVGRVVSSPQEALAALPGEPTFVQVWSPDTDAGNARAGQAAAWKDTLDVTRREHGVVDPVHGWNARESGAWLGQVCLVGDGVAVVGAVRAREALSLSAGGRSRMKRTGEAPSRAAMKLDEALEWYGVEPGKGERCVDLGSAPGGWTRRLVERGAKVWSVDPAKLTADLESHQRVRHVVASAFDFEPEAMVDWLFCDMAWRPLEVAQLLGKWARRRWALHLVANLKLPMKDKLPVVATARGLLEAGGWRHVRSRQLYHDREEVTVTARLTP